MSEAKHTPGPWVEFTIGGETVAIMAAGRPDEVCSLDGPIKGADARLIAAAPAMYEALRLWKVAAFNSDRAGIENAKKLRNAALSLAEGK